MIPVTSREILSAAPSVKSTKRVGGGGDNVSTPGVLLVVVGALVLVVVVVVVVVMKAEYSMGKMFLQNITICQMLELMEAARNSK